MAELKRNEPTADVLMTSMRSMGYTFESAIADVIDNSVSAKCHEIRLKFPIDPQDCYVAICDDGEGMSKDELFDAMKYGSQLKKDYLADWMHLKVGNRVGDVYHDIVMKDVMLVGPVTLSSEYDYTSDDALELEVKFRFDWWDEVNA